MSDKDTSEAGADKKKAKSKTKGKDANKSARAMAKEFVIQIRLYRMFAGLLTLAGFVIFAYFYFAHIQTRFFEAITDPGTIGMVLIPFVPAGIFIFFAGRAEKKLGLYLEDAEKEIAAEKAAIKAAEERDLYN